MVSTYRHFLANQRTLFSQGDYMSNDGKIQSIERAIRILNLLSDEGRELRLQEICDRLDLNKSTAHGIISTLKYYGFIGQNEDTQKYHLGLKLCELGSRVLNKMDIREVSAPVLKTVCSEIGETAFLGVLDGCDVVFIDKCESSRSLRVSTSIGTRQCAHTSAIGKAILAFLGEEEQIRHFPGEFEAYTKYSIRNQEELVKELHETKRRGYSVVDEEYAEGLIAVGAPIFNHEGKVAGGIGVVGSTAKITKKRLPGVGRILCDAAEKISMDLGCRTIR